MFIQPIRTNSTEKKTYELMLKMQRPSCFWMVVVVFMYFSFLCICIQLLTRVLVCMQTGYASYPYVLGVHECVRFFFVFPTFVYSLWCLLLFFRVFMHSLVCKRIEPKEESNYFLITFCLSSLEYFDLFWFINFNVFLLFFFFGF